MIVHNVRPRKVSLSLGSNFTESAGAAPMQRAVTLCMGQAINV